MLTVIESKIRKLQQEFFSQSSFDLSLGDSIISSNLSINWQEIDSIFFAGDNLISLKKLLQYSPEIIDLC